jgi:hypothetical protein
MLSFPGLDSMLDAAGSPEQQPATPAVPAYFTSFLVGVGTRFAFLNIFSSYWHVR